MWALSNATSGGFQQPGQVDYLVKQGCIKGLCEILQCRDSTVVKVATDGLRNIWRVGQRNMVYGQNHYSTLIEEVGGQELVEQFEDMESEEVDVC